MKEKEKEECSVIYHHAHFILSVTMTESFDETDKNLQTLHFFSTSSKTLRFWACLSIPPLITMVSLSLMHVIRYSRLLIKYWIVEIHKNCFCTFIVVSELYMLLTYYLNKNSRRDPNLTQSESKSLNLKRNLFIINITSILLASYFFVRHNDRCEGGSKLTS